MVARSRTNMGRSGRGPFQCDHNVNGPIEFLPGSDFYFFINLVHTCFIILWSSAFCVEDFIIP